MENSSHHNSAPGERNFENGIMPEHNPIITCVSQNFIGEREHARANNNSPFMHPLMMTGDLAEVKEEVDMDEFDISEDGDTENANSHLLPAAHVQPLQFVEPGRENSDPLTNLLMMDDNDAVEAEMDMDGVNNISEESGTTSSQTLPVVHGSSLEFVELGMENSSPLTNPAIDAVEAGMAEINISGAPLAAAYASSLEFLDIEEVVENEALDQEENQDDQMYFDAYLNHLGEENDTTVHDNTAQTESSATNNFNIPNAESINDGFPDEPNMETQAGSSVGSSSVNQIDPEVMKTVYNFMGNCCRQLNDLFNASDAVRHTQVFRYLDEIYDLVEEGKTKLARGEGNL